MRWRPKTNKPPKQNDTRIVKKFLFQPELHYIMNDSEVEEYRWLEFAKIWQYFQEEGCASNEYSYWKSVYWVD